MKLKELKVNDEVTRTNIESLLFDNITSKQLDRIIIRIEDGTQYHFEVVYNGNIYSTQKPKFVYKGRLPIYETKMRQQ